MFDVLVTLALIPLALMGLGIVLGLGWLLMPYALVVGGAAFALLCYFEPTMKPYMFWPVGVFLGGLFWAVKRSES